MKLADLTVSLDEHTPVYPGDPLPIISRTASVEKDGFTQHSITIPTHIGTHIDAPSHMLEQGLSFASYDITRFIGTGYLIDVRKGLSRVISVQPPANSIILFYTGWSLRRNDKSYYTDYEPLTEEIGEWLVAHNPKAVGFDMSGPDYQPFPIHKILLRAGIPIIENLCNLDKLENRKFRVIALPMKLDLDGSPARVIAELL